MLDPQAQALIDLMEARGVPPTHTLTPAEARASTASAARFSQPDPRRWARCAS
jgi:acetyl esterase